MIANVDKEIGYLLKLIQENELENKTNIIIVSDHGKFTFHAQWIF